MKLNGAVLTFSDDEEILRFPNQLKKLFNWPDLYIARIRIETNQRSSLKAEQREVSLV